MSFPVTVVVVYSQLSGNAASEGGAVSVNGRLAVINMIESTLRQNSAIDRGGAIRVDSGTMSVDSCVVESNSATRGGALDDVAGSVTAVQSQFNLNTAVDGGALGNSGTLTVAACSVVANTAYRGGGVFSDGGALTVLNSTFSSNSGWQTGGGLHIDAGTAVLVSLTVSENASPTGGGLYVGVGAGVLLRDSIVWGNTDLNGATNTIEGAPLDSSSSWNLIGVGGSGGLIPGTNHNLVGVLDAGLLPLGNNGGTTLTYALSASSPARSAGDPTLVGDALFGFDQRNVARTNPVSIGAFQA
jgi:hypothetical protein